VPLLILIALMGLTGAYFIPRQERLAQLAESGAQADYAALFSQVARVVVVAALLVVVAVFVMATKP
jgi:hypothetical protein